MRAVFLLGRAIFGGFFVYNGINHFLNEQGMRQYAASKGVASPDVAVQASGALLVAGGLSVVAGVSSESALSSNWPGSNGRP